MKKERILLCNLLLSSTLFWGVPSVEAEEMISGDSYRHHRLLPSKVPGDA